MLGGDYVIVKIDKLSSAEKEFYKTWQFVIKTGEIGFVLSPQLIIEVKKIIKSVVASTISSFNKALENLILNGSILYTDGHASYPSIKNNRTKA